MIFKLCMDTIPYDIDYMILFIWIWAIETLKLAQNPMGL